MVIAINISNTCIKNQHEVLYIRSVIIMLSKHSATTDYLSGHTTFSKWEMIIEMLTETVVLSSNIQINNELCHESFISTKNFEAKKCLVYFYYY
jgi:hypothetical protein